MVLEAALLGVVKDIQAALWCAAAALVWLVLCQPISDNPIGEPANNKQACWLEGRPAPGRL